MKKKLFTLSETEDTLYSAPTISVVDLQAERCFADSEEEGETEEYDVDPHTAD